MFQVVLSVCLLCKIPNRQVDYCCGYNYEVLFFESGTVQSENEQAAGDLLTNTIVLQAHIFAIRTHICRLDILRKGA